MKLEILSDGTLLYKGVYIDTKCTYYPELLQTTEAILGVTKPCVAHLPDIERCFDKPEKAMGFIDRNLRRIRKRCDEHSKKHGLPF